MYEEINWESLEIPGTNDASHAQITWISHNSLLNCLFILTSDNKLILYDCNSKILLKKVEFALEGSPQKLKFLRIYNIQDKCIIASERTICSRLAHDGLFLLDTVFQTSFNSTAAKQNQQSIKNRISLELNCFDAKSLLAALKLIESENVNGLEEIILDLERQISELKVASPTDQWATVKITDTYSNLLTILSQSLDETKRINLQSPAIPTLSMLLDRLYRLDTSLIESQLQSHTIGSMFSNFDKRYMCSESTRRATFNQWPHMDYKWVLPDALAQAGFFHQPTHPGDDRTICFACDLCLVAWEQQDQPWSEHERHSPICQFVRGEITENVPLSLTASNQCASQIFKVNENTETITCTSELSSERYFAVSNATGHIVVYDSKDLLKEMMHVQLINESPSSKEHKLTIHTLCFYYRNHKHVLYGSFTINNEVFVFSFNIFDIYRSYHSKSNKKPSKSQKSSSSTKSAKTATTTTANPPLPKANFVSNTNASLVAAEPDKNATEASLKNNEFTSYMNDIIKLKQDSKLIEQELNSMEAPLLPPLPPLQASQVDPLPMTNNSKLEKQDSSSSTNKEDINSETENPPVSAGKCETSNGVSGGFLPPENLVKTEEISKSDKQHQKKIELLQQQQQAITILKNNNFENLIINNTSAHPSTNQSSKINFVNLSNAAQSSGKASSSSNTSNLSNFLVVRFELCSNQETTSKSKSKYKKSIKIISVSSKPLKYFESAAHAACADIQLKTYEFTEKCLSFRLACLDLNSATSPHIENRNDFDIKIINLYEKYLCALVNFKMDNSRSSFKLFRIKHEETTTTGATALADSLQMKPTKEVIPNETLINAAAGDTTGVVSTQNCLTATSSSRLNLTEFTLNEHLETNAHSNLRIISMLPISVTTFDDENDLKYIAILDENGTISIVDPAKCVKINQFNSPDQENKFVFMTYCNGIDKICAYTQKNKIFFISTHVYPIVNQSILDEASGAMNLSEMSSSKQLLVDAPIKPANLAALHSLIFFEATKTNFSTKLPSGWLPILSDQNQQRKHPQHIHAEINNYSKSWCNADNLMENCTIEIYLNKPMQIGCFQVKLKFNKELTSPFELRLFKQKKNFDTTNKGVDNKIDFFNVSDKYELLFGPIDISEFLDLSCSKTYVITISSDKLLETRSNLFFLNLRPQKEPLVNEPKLGLNSISPSMLHKLSITIHKYRRTGLPNETIERSLMLMRGTFFSKILEFISENTDTQSLLNALDILNWIVFNHFSIESSVQLHLMAALKQHLNKLLTVFYLHGNRSTSRKATMLLNFLLNKNLDREKSFGGLLLKNLMSVLKLLPYFESSASMNWYFVLIHRVMALDSQNTYENCMHMLIALSKGYDYNPLYALLKMRYNFSCLVFESSLFDIDLYFKFNITNQKLMQQSQQQQQQQQSTGSNLNNPYSFGSVGISLTGAVNNMNINNSSNMNIGGNPFGNAQTNSNLNSNTFGSSANTNNNNNNLHSINYNSQNCIDVFSSSLSPGSNKELVNSFPQSVGLLEVLPLNFKCSACSNGTQVEKNNLKQDTSLYVLPDFFSFVEADATKPESDQNGATPDATTQQPPVDFSIFNSIFTFQPLQYLIVERLEPVSRHFITIDFGFPVAITDIMIPACSELSSLSIDYWTFKELKDSKRLCVSTNVHQNSILLNELQPPVVCRYIKLIFVSQSANVVKAKIPIGYYFGYPQIFCNENTIAETGLSYLSHLEKLYEDNHCHYSMSIGKLRELLNEIQFPSDNIGHLKMMQFNLNENNDLSTRIKSVYKECLDYQFQLNLNAQLIKRIRLANGLETNDRKQLMARMREKVDLDDLVAQMSQDKLRVANGLLIRTLLCLTYEFGLTTDLILKSAVAKPLALAVFPRNQLDLAKACKLFKDLCVYGNFEKECSLLLLRCCHTETWWGDFISACLRTFFVNKVKEVTPLSRVFVTLNDICVKSLNGGSQTNSLFECLFSLVDEILQPLQQQLDNDDLLGAPAVEVTSLEWILLFISRLLSALDKPREAASRWDFLENIYSNFKANSKQFSMRNKSKIKKKLFQSNKYFTWNKLKENRKHFEKYRKSFWKADQLSQFGGQETTANKQTPAKKICLPRNVTLSAGRSIVKLLISANSFCSSDLFVLSCRIISSLCCHAQPHIGLEEIIDRKDLNQLILLNISAEFNHGSVCWGSPYSQYPILSLFMDVIESERAKDEQCLIDLPCSSIEETQSDAKEFTKIIEENEEPSIEKVIEAASSSVYDAIKLSSNLAKNFTQISDMLEVHLNDVDKKPFKIDETDAAEEFKDEKTSELIEDNEEEDDEEAETLANVSNNKFAKLDFASIKNLNLLEALTHLKNTGISVSLSAMISAAVSNQGLFPQQKFSSLSYLQSIIPLASMGGVVDPRLTPLIDLQNITITYDNRLDSNVYQTVENNLYMNMCIQNETINKSLSEPLPLTADLQPSNSSKNLNEDVSKESDATRPSSIRLIQETLETLFEDLSKVNIENLLTFWLTLGTLDQETDKMGEFLAPPPPPKPTLFYLNEQTCTYLIDYLLKYSFMNVKLWHLTFRMLTCLLSNTGSSQPLLVASFVQNNSLYKLIYKFVSANEELMGDECCHSLLEFLHKLNKLCVSNECEKVFKKSLFQIVCDCIEESGCIRRFQGPLDAQVVFVEYLMGEDLLVCFDAGDEADKEQFELMTAKYFDSLSRLVHHHICVYPRLSVKGVTSPRSCFTGFLSSLMFGSSRTSLASFSQGVNTLSEKTKLTLDTMSQQFLLNPHSTSTTGPHQPGMLPSKLTELKANTSFQNTSKYSILCTRDNLVCLLLKNAINVIANIKLSTKLAYLMDYTSTQGSVFQKQPKRVFHNNGSVNYFGNLKPNKQAKSSESDESDPLMNGYYEDDLFLQQLFLYELQQIDDNSEASPALEEDTGAKKALLKLVNQQNLKANRLIKALSDECLELFVESLGLCQSSALAMVISNSCYPIELNVEDIKTPGDGLFLLLKSISVAPLKLVQPCHNYLSKIKRLSEPLLWFFSALFSNEQVMHDFIERGGIDIISKGLSTTTRQLLYSGPCIISSLMNLIDTEKQQLKALNNNYDNESTEGFTNFAAFGSIMCTNPCGNPVDVLLQNTAPHRRIRSAIWSYHFQPNEHKIGLFITFPYTFLLKEIHILPHTVSFGNCPAYVSVEVSRDGTFLTPIGPPVNTIGMLSIKLQLNKSELVNTIQINLYKSKDSQAVGLSQIRLLGYPIFENMLSAKPDMMLTPVEDLVSRSNMGWLRLLYLCLTSTPHIQQLVCRRIENKIMLLCTRLLASPAIIIYDKIIETILVKLGKYNAARNLDITKCLLRLENGADSGGLYSVPHGVLIETLVNILFQITDLKSSELMEKSTDEGVNLESARFELILNWLKEQCLSSSSTARKTDGASNMLMHCVACLIYKSAEPQSHLNESRLLVESLIEYAIASNEYYSKQAIDWVVCSVFYKKPSSILILTEMISLDQLEMLLQNELHDYETSFVLKKRFRGLIETLSFAVQSPEVIEILLTSCFFARFVTIFERLIASSSNADISSQENHIFEFNFLPLFTSLAEFEYGQNWLCTIGTGIWQRLIELLCQNRPNALNHTEEMCTQLIKLVKKMLFCNQNNQKIFSIYLTQLIKQAVPLGGTRNGQDKPATTAISGFLNQLILQVFLEEQTLTVNFQRCSTVFKVACNSSLGLLTHPRYGTGSGCRCVDLVQYKTCTDMINLITDTSISQMLSKDKSATKQSIMDGISNNTDESSSIKTSHASKTTDSMSAKLKLVLKLPDQREISLPGDMTLLNVLRLYLSQCRDNSIKDFTLIVQLNEEDNESAMTSREYEDMASYVMSTPLDEFVKCDGLTTLAERLPILMPFIQEPLLNITEKDKCPSGNEQSGNSKTSPDFVDYVIMNESDEPFVDDIYNEIPANLNALNQTSKLKKITMPPYSFIAFGLFLKIPGYARMMLKNRRQAQCILKLLLGANRNKEEEFSLSLSTMPFESLRDLLNETKESGDAQSKADMCRFFAEQNILILIFSVLSSISHHPHKKPAPHFNHTKLMNAGVATQVSSTSSGAQATATAPTEEQKNNLYWAKGTGFGTGSTIQHWDAEKTMMQQKMEEEHVTCILEILANFIECCFENTTPKLIEIIDDSCIINALSSYLRNDSVLDMSRHIPLYKSALKLVQSFILEPKLRLLIQNCNIFDLVKNMKQFVDTYIQKIKLTEEDEGLASMVPILNTTYDTVNSFLKPATDKELDSNRSSMNALNIEKIYCDIMKNFQFDSFLIINENSNGTFKANIGYFYESSLNEANNFNNPNRAKRLAQETVTISNSLPISYSSTVFARCDEERLDVMKVLITGPKDTPYDNGCFEFDVFFPADYPDSPPMVNLQTTGNQTVRFNPNLYHDGKVCLSILNTWHGRPEERWNGQTSSFLQVLVSIQSLILVSEPYFNEPGYERSRGTPAGTASSIEYDANIRQATVKWAMLEALKKPSLCFKEAIRNHFYLKRKEIKEQCELWAKEMELHVNDKQIGLSVSKSYISLKRHMSQLYEELDKLEASEDLITLEKCNSHESVLDDELEIKDD